MPPRYHHPRRLSESEFLRRAEALALPRALVEVGWLWFVRGFTYHGIARERQVQPATVHRQVSAILTRFVELHTRECPEPEPKGSVPAEDVEAMWAAYRQRFLGGANPEYEESGNWWTPAYHGTAESRRDLQDVAELAAARRLEGPVDRPSGETVPRKGRG